VLIGPLAAPGLPVFEKGLVDRLLANMASEQKPVAMIEFTLPCCGASAPRRAHP
jgi:hypothetical protein